MKTFYQLRLASVVLMVFGILGLVFNPFKPLPPEVQAVGEACNAVSSYNQVEIRKHFLITALQWEKPAPMMPKLIAASAKHSTCSHFEVINTTNSGVIVKLEVNAFEVQNLVSVTLKEHLNQAVLLYLAGKTQQAEALWQEQVISRLEAGNIPSKTSQLEIPLERIQDRWRMTERGRVSLLNALTGGLTGAWQRGK